MRVNLTYGSYCLDKVKNDVQKDKFYHSNLHFFFLSILHKLQKVKSERGKDSMS